MEMDEVREGFVESEPDQNEVVPPATAPALPQAPSSFLSHLYIPVLNLV